MNYKRMFFILQLILLPLVALCADRRMPTLDDLDAAVRDRQKYVDTLLQTIEADKQALKRVQTAKERYDICDALFSRYSSLNIDSAYQYAGMKYCAALKMGNTEDIVYSKLNIIYMLVKCGMYKEAEQSLLEIDRSSLPPATRWYYFSTARTLYEEMAFYSMSGTWRRQYEKLTREYSDSIIEVNPSTDIWTKAYVLIDRGEYEQAKDMIRETFDKTPFTHRDMGFIAYSLSDIAHRQNNREEEKHYLIASAYSDMKNAVKEYASLARLAKILFEEGDVRRAYTYMMCSMEDAIYCDARLRISQVSELLPIVDEAYRGLQRREAMQMKLATLGVSIFAVILAGLIFYIRRQMHRLSLQKEELHETNMSLREANNIKQTYITKFLTDCSAYIDKLSDYCKLLNRTASKGDVAELYRQLKSTAMIERELDEFYAKFDTTFLRLFPNFIDDMNALLNLNEHLETKKDGRLSTELRIMALMRLGITDNDIIASFLRVSKATVYSYRSRTRLKSPEPDKFEAQVMLIHAE